MNRLTSTLLVSVALSAAAVTAPTQAQTGGVAAQTAARQSVDLARTADSVKALSQALKRVSGQQHAELIGRVDKTIQSAEAAAAAGRPGEARVMLDEAYLRIRSALVEVMRSRPAEAAPTGAPTMADDPVRERAAYDERMKSVRALRDALARIADEKNDAAGKAEVATIDKLLGQSTQLVSDGNLRYGRAVLDHVYLRGKIQIERLRRGDTLVRALRFDTPEDEYHYEIDRNDTHRLLVTLLVSEEGKTDGRLKDFMDQAHRLRRQADVAAENHRFEEAVKTLERSTAEYQKAIRAAGILLPG